MAVVLVAALLSGVLQAHSDPNVRVYSVTKGDRVDVVVKLTHVSEVTVSLSTTLRNMKARPAGAFTVDVEGEGEHKVMTLTPIDPSAAWHYDWHEEYWLGHRLKTSPKKCVYKYPFKVGVLSQGPHGSYSHQLGGQDAEAYDWTMPIGSPVLAARPGKVIAVREESNRGGANLAEFKADANYVVIRHDDGTFAEYEHLKKGGVLVRLGAKVSLGQKIGLSGGTGHVTMPHLHFAVYYPIDGKIRKTLPITFAR